MLANERPRVDRRRPRLGKPDMEIAGDLASPSGVVQAVGRMDRKPLEGDAMGGPDNDDPFGGSARRAQAPKAVAATAPE